jgi:ribokinase
MSQQAFAGTVVVIGSVNVDYVVTASRLPAPGETVLGGSFERHFGGKGANQAVAAARAGARARLIACVGADADGADSLADLAAEGVDVGGRVVAGRTGMAIIAVDAEGRNQIVVAPGANMELTAEDARAAVAAAQRGSVAVTSLEVPMPAVEAAVLEAARRGLRTIVNPAPASPLPEALLAARPLLVPNEHEALEIFGAGDLAEVVRRLHAAEVDAVITLGPAGCLVVAGGDEVPLSAAATARVVDTTGAGDATVGVLATWLAEGRSLREAAQAAMVAAARTVGGAGARAGMPHRDELEAAMGLERRWSDT